ncbi:MAG: type II secretion system F family protein, partial [Synergistaceae bacterium]|nr:type II secretion system F family protein [Synergistaceae bacterium]
TLRKSVIGVKEQVNSGVTMATAMGKYPKIFGTLETSLIHAGEEGGVLEISLDRLATFLEKQDALRKKVKSAMTYPTVVIVITLLVMGLMVAIVVPQFKNAYAGLGITPETMPLLTKSIFALAEFLQTKWFLVPLPIIGVYLSWASLGYFPQGRRIQDIARIKAPVVGDIIFKVIITRAFRTLATLVSAGVPILEALDMSGAVADNVIVTEAFMKIKEKAQNGMPINTTMKEQAIFPAMVGHMVAVGEETGRIDEMLEKIAEWYDTELEEKIKGLTSIIEPVLIVFVGIGVGLVVGAVFIPLISAMQHFM